MTRIKQKLTVILLAALIIVTLLPAMGSLNGGRIGTQTAHAVSAYAPSIQPERNTISLRVGGPYAGTRPGNIGSWEEVLDEAAGTKITVMDMWIESASGPMNEDSGFEAGKEYTYQAYIASVTDSGTAPDLSGWTVTVESAYSGSRIQWPDGTFTCDKEAGSILYTAHFTAREAPSRDKGTYKLSVAEGKIRITDKAAMNSLSMLSVLYPTRFSEAGYDNEVDLDQDGAYDIGLKQSFRFDYVECGKLSTTKIKDPFTVKMPAELKTMRDKADIDYYGKITIEFVKKITPKLTLSATSYTWNGKAKKPSVTVKAGSKKLTTSDYKVTYASGRKNVGKYNVKVTLKGNYAGTKTVKFSINPKGTSLKTLTPASKAITVKWAKQSTKMSSARITGYQIQLATDSKFTKNKQTVTVKGYGTVSKKVLKLTGGRKYYVRIRTYMKVGGANYYSSWSKAKAVTTKK